MATPSPSRTTRHSLGWLMLLVAALFARGMAPEGWMPVASADGGIEIAVCNGMAPMVLSKDGTLHQKAPMKGAGEHCAFAGMGVADASPPLPAIVAPPRAATAATAIDRLATVPGRGLAAPPPPATGPPALT